MQPVFVAPMQGTSFEPSVIPAEPENKEENPEMSVAISTMLDGLGLSGLSHAYELMHTASELKSDASAQQFYVSANPSPKASLNPTKAFKPS